MEYIVRAEATFAYLYFSLTSFMVMPFWTSLYKLLYFKSIFSEFISRNVLCIKFNK